MIDTFNEWSLSATALAIAIAWQSSLLAALVAGICWFLRRSSPAVRYWCWQIVAVKLLLMPWWIVAIPLPDLFGDGGAETASRKATANEIRTPARFAALDGLIAPQAGDTRAASDARSSFEFHLSLTWRSWFVLFWLVGIACQAVCILIQYGRLRRLLNRATAVTEPRWLAVMDQVAAQLGLRRRPALVVVEGHGLPFVCGLFCPVVVLSRDFLADLDADHWRQVALHELGHIKRRDLWWGWLPALARIVYFFHPVAHWICFRARLERELACDQLTMAHGGHSAADYADVLLQMISRASMPAALTMSSLEGLSTFWRRRFTMLISTSRSSPQVSATTRLAVASAAIAAGLLPTFQQAPAQAQPDPGAQSNGRIYVNAALRLEAGGQDKEQAQHGLIIAIDPATGEWQLIAENGYDPRLSRDGKMLAFSRFDNGLWKCEADGQFVLKISDNQGRPVWSPDGKYLVATEQENLDKENDKYRTTPAWRDETWRLDADGRNAVKLPIRDTDAVNDWSPDGQWFVTSTDRHPPFGRGYQLYLMKTDGTQERRLTEGGLNVYARFSPDGKKILYLHQTRKDGNGIWTVDIDGTNAKQIVKEVGLASPDGAFWSPDGKQIAALMFNWQIDEKGQKVRNINSDTTDFRIEIMDADGANRRRLKLAGARFVFIGSLGDWR